MIKIILAEDHNIVRNGIKSLLEKDSQFSIIGEAVNGQDVLDMLDSGHNPDVILADMNMPVVGGLELINRLNEVGHPAKIVVLTMLDHEKYIIQAFKAGAKGFLLKNVGSLEMIFAIKQVADNNQYLCSELSLRMLNKLMHAPEPSLENLSDVDLSKREMEVLNLIADGFTNQEIADKLFTSKRTVEGHRQSLLDKTNTRNTAALVRFALVNSIIN
ncbi:response regulator transcription factor [Mucilaginibacter sp. RS28]|uniref:Response regulator transcription factor n=1 Tax=Mucilaginibacter straminoryzae TaxID=2932774 RepID=A0A9X2BA67_9SPHI|nr:response regulator transcription factor [Mucilaginibacter straminoryzae]MCJ8210465.1 response regulator transcription factor [Mucilaginibacter straminoryzae]